MRQTRLFPVAQMAIFVYPTISAHTPLIAMSAEVGTILLGVQMGRSWIRALARHAQIDVVSDIQTTSYKLLLLTTLGAFSGYWLAGRCL